MHLLTVGACRSFLLPSFYHSLSSNRHSFPGYLYICGLPTLFSSNKLAIIGREVGIYWYYYSTAVSFAFLLFLVLVLHATNCVVICKENI